jgi:hypothetical protein
LFWIVSFVLAAFSFTLSFNVEAASEISLRVSFPDFGAHKIPLANPAAIPPIVPTATFLAVSLLCFFAFLFSY